MVVQKCCMDITHTYAILLNLIHIEFCMNQKNLIYQKQHIFGTFRGLNWDLNILNVTLHDICIHISKYFKLFLSGIFETFYHRLYHDYKVA